jgi:hypothetical protein
MRTRSPQEAETIIETALFDRGFAFGLRLVSHLGLSTLCLSVSYLFLSLQSVSARDSVPFNR